MRLNINFIRDKKIFFKIIIVVTILILTYSCSSNRYKNNIISVYYKNISDYQNKEIKNKLEEIAFQYNIKLDFVSSTDKNYMDKLFKYNPSTVIIEEDSLNVLKKIYRKAKDSAELVLITSKITNKQYCDYYFSTDFESLGEEEAKYIFNYTRKKGRTFIIFKQRKYESDRETFLKGLSSFFISRGDIVLKTNYYSKDEEFDTEKFKNLIYSSTNHIRGIIVDDDSYGINIAKELRRMGKDNEIKVGSFGSSLEGIDAILKGEIMIDGDIDRYNLFVQAFKILMSMRKEKRFDNKKIIYYDKGIYYTQANIVDKMALSKKYSIREILASGYK